MGDFVGEYRRDFIVGLKGLQKAASHEDVTRRHRESVDLVGVDYLEPIPIAFERNGPAVKDTLPDTSNVLLQLCVDEWVVGGLHMLQRHHCERMLGRVVRYVRCGNETDAAPVVSEGEGIGLRGERLPVSRVRQVIRPADVKRLALSISDVPLKVSFGGRHLKYLVEPTFETLRRRSLAVEVYAPTAETRALQFQFDVVIFWICVRDSNSLAFTKREQAVPPMESENAIVFHI